MSKVFIVWRHRPYDDLILESVWLKKEAAHNEVKRLESEMGIWEKAAELQYFFTEEEESEWALSFIKETL